MAKQLIESPCHVMFCAGGCPEVGLSSSVSTASSVPSHSIKRQSCRMSVDWQSCYCCCFWRFPINAFQCITAWESVLKKKYVKVMLSSFTSQSSRGPKRLHNDDNKRKLDQIIFFFKPDSIVHTYNLMKAILNYFLLRLSTITIVLLAFSSPS